jgi:hypothetical protein
VVGGANFLFPESDLVNDLQMPMLAGEPRKNAFSMTRKRLLLNHLTPIASGNNRDVFVHPEDAGLLVKTVRSDALEKRSSPDAHWTKRLFRRYRHYQTFLRECQEHIVSRLDEAGVPGFVHTVVGFVDTDRGLGLVARAERDRSGAYAKTLAKLIAEGLYDDEAKRAMEDFKEAFLRSDVIITDLGHGNLVYAYEEGRGNHFVVIDGFGEKNLIPFNSWFRWCHRRSKRKRVARLGNSVARAIRRREDALSG